MQFILYRIWFQELIFIPFLSRIQKTEWKMISYLLKGFLFLSETYLIYLLPQKTKSELTMMRVFTIKYASFAIYSFRFVCNS